MVIQIFYESSFNRLISALCGLVNVLSLVEVLNNLVVHVILLRLAAGGAEVHAEVTHRATCLISASDFDGAAAAT